MGSTVEWCREAYATSISSRCWWFTPYDAGWDACANISKDTELKEIVVMEATLSLVLDWARQIVETSIRFLPACGAYTFPLPFLECVSAIGEQTPPTFVHGCFTADSAQKKAMQDYCLCLDAWLAGASPDSAAAELAALGYRKIDWHKVCRGLWNVLSPRSELKELLIERLLHSQRWKIKSYPWDNNPCDQFGRDQYLGDFRQDGCEAKREGYIACELHGFKEKSSPRINELERKLVASCADWKWFRYTIEYGWMCSPKAFRHLECLIWSIGKERQAATTRDHPLKDAQQVPGLLQCEDTYLNQDEAAAWWRDFLSSLAAWWQGKELTGPLGGDITGRLVQRTPLKRWLVRLLVRNVNSWSPRADP